MGVHFKSIKEMRSAHMAKLVEVSAQSFRLLQQEPQQSSDKRQEQDAILKAIRAQAHELSMQLSNFDDAIIECIDCVSRTAGSGVDMGTAEGKSASNVIKAAKNRMFREVYRLNLALPALSLRHEVEKKVRSSQFVVIQGATGSGKSTQLPQYLAELLEHDNCANRKVICTQPRKVSATSLAERVSEEWSVGDKTKLGTAVGYRVGATKKSWKHTKIEYVTEGTFLGTLLQLFGITSEDRENQTTDSDPLQGVGAIVVDEAHERSTTCDLILGMLKMHAPVKWPHLKIIITSATLDSQLFSNYFNDAPVLQIPGRMFPVEVKHLPLEGSSGDMAISSGKYADAVVKTALEIHNNSKSDSGDILCFLTGQDETEKAKDKFTSLVSKLNYSPALALALYGKQLPAEQKLVFIKPPAGTRKVIFATDVAETGVTIDGVRHIVDSGLCKESRYDPKRNVTVLSVQSICQSSAVQRKGRAGRTAPGTCYRLYSEDDFDALEVSQVPEVLSRPLPLTVVSLLSMGIHPLHFEWIQSPDRAGLQQAIDELHYLGAIVENSAASSSSAGSKVGSVPELTELGRLVADLQVDPGMARMIYHACKQGLGETACSLAGIMSVASSFYYRGAVNDTEGRASADAKHLTFCSESGDMVAMYGAFCEWEALMNGYLAAPSPTGKTSDGDDLSVLSSLDEDTDSIEKELLQLDSSDSVLSGSRNSKQQYAADGVSDIRGEDIDGDGGLSALFSRLAKDTINVDLSEGGSASHLKKHDDSSILNEDSDDDATSVISALSDRTYTENSVQEERKNRFAASKEATRWCRDNFLNNKSLNIAFSAKKDIIRLLQKFDNGSLWKFLPDGSATDQKIVPSSTSIQRLIVKGLFLNVSIQTSEFRGYEVLRNDTPTVGMIHPGSSLSKLADNRSEGRSGSLYPRFLVFHTMLTTSRTFLNVVTPVEEEWIRDESPSFYNNVMLHNMARSRCAKLVLEGIRLNTSRSLLGKFGDKKKALEESLNCSIQYDFMRNALEVWCTPGDLENVKQSLKEGIEAVKRTCLQEVEEMTICGSTRAIFGAGGLVKSLLFDDQFVSVNISGLAMNTEASELKAYLSTSFGDIRSVDLTYPSGGDARKQMGNAFAKVVFHNAADAARACEQLQGEVWKGHTLTIGRGGIRSSALQPVTATSQVIMSWALSVSEGKATADFLSPESANSLLQLCLASKGLRCPVLQGLGNEVHIRANIPPSGDSTKRVYLFPTGQQKQGASPFFRISIKGLHPHIDEVDLEEAFKQIERMGQSNPALSRFKCPVRVRVFRAAAQEAVRDETALSIETAELRSMIPMSDKLVSATSFFHSGGSGGRAGFYLQYDTPDNAALVRPVWERQIDQMKQSNARTVAGEPSWMKYGQPIRLSEKFSSHVNIHTALHSFFKAEIDACFQDLSKRLHVTTRFAKPKKVVGRKYADPKTTVYLNAPNAAALDLAIDALNRLLSFEIYTPRNDEEKHILFSPPGRRAMMAISDQVAYLHWDNASRIVRVYGSKDVAEAAMARMTEAIQRIAVAQEKATYPVSRHKRKLLLTTWRQLKGPLKDDVMSFCVDGLKLEVQGSADTLACVHTWLQEGKFIANQGSSKPACDIGCDTDDELCSVCMCEVDQPSYYYRACDHGGCVSCLNYQFSRLAEITVPATCFSMDCGRCHISWPDIKAVVPPDAVDVIKSAAVSKFVRENSSVRFCPSNGCDQILDLSETVTPGSVIEQERFGGTVAYCSQCRVEYCLHCSDRDNKPRTTHKGDSCEENIEEDNAWRVHFQHIADDVLTLRCPTCHAAFIDFDGCCAVACGGSGCGKYFCGLCLQPHPNSSVSHAHVLKCPKNPHTNNYFCAQEELNKVHRHTIVGNLRKYLESSVPKGDTKRKLMKNLEPLLADLGIFPADVL